MDGSIREPLYPQQISFILQLSNTALSYASAEEVAMYLLAANATIDIKHKVRKIYSSFQNN